MKRNSAFLGLALVCGLGAAIARADTFGVNFTNTIGNNSSGTLLVSGAIAAGTVDPLDDKFRVISVTPTALAAEQIHYIGALFATANDFFVSIAAGFTTPAGITFDSLLPTVILALAAGSWRKTRQVNP